MESCPLSGGECCGEPCSWWSADSDQPCALAPLAGLVAGMISATPVNYGADLTDIEAQE